MRRLDYDPDMPDDVFDLSWSEWRQIIAGFLVVIVFIVGVTIAAGGT